MTVLRQATMALLLAGTAAAANAGTWNLHDAVGAYDRLKLSGSVRIRTESYDGQPRPGRNADVGVLVIRSTLAAEYDLGGGTRIGGELWDSRVYGGAVGDGISATDVNTLEPIQAWIATDIKLGDGGKATLKFGRFTMSYGSSRLVAVENYRNVNNGFTGARADFKWKSGVAATAFYTMPQRRLPDAEALILDNNVHFDREDSDLIFWGSFVTVPKAVAGAQLELGYFGLDESDEPGRVTRLRNLHSFDARLFKAPAVGQVDADLEAIYQTGRARTAATAGLARTAVEAGFVHAEFGYTWDSAWKPHLSFEYDWASGDGRSAKFNRFDSLFGSRSSDLGPSGVYGVIPRANISAPGVRLELTPTKRLDLMTSLRAVSLAKSRDSFGSPSVRDATGAFGRNVGTASELRVRYWVVPKLLRAEVNAAWLDKGRFLNAAPNAPRTGNSHYLSVAAVATF